MTVNNESINQRLAEIVKRHRKKAGLTQSHLAKIAGVGKTVVFDIEHAKETVRFNSIVCILRALNIAVDFISPWLLVQKRGDFNSFKHC